MKPPSLTVCAFKDVESAARGTFQRGNATTIFRVLALVVLVLLVTQESSQGTDATWLASPPSADWNTSANWIPIGVPNGSADTATFAVSNKPNVSLSADVEVSSIVFNPGATAFTITAPGPIHLTTLIVSGSGIENNSGSVQTFVVRAPTSGSVSASGMIQFTNNATAGISTRFTVDGGPFTDAIIEFRGNSTAGQGVFTVNGGDGFGAAIGFIENSTADHGTFVINGGGAGRRFGGILQFNYGATAANATIIANGGEVLGSDGCQVFFSGDSSAGHSVLTVNGGLVSGATGCTTGFSDHATAASATIIVNGGPGIGANGSIFFNFDSAGGTARTKILDNGVLEISFHNSPGLTIGSLEGNGQVFLGANSLTVGTNNLSTTFSGVFQDGGLGGGVGGSLGKTGSGTFSVTNASSYSGGTIISSGTLVASHAGALGTGSVSLTAPGATLTLRNANILTRGLSIVTGSIVNLAFSGTNTVGHLFVNGIEQTPGLYGSASSGASHQLSELKGSGKILVIPSPVHLQNISARLRVQMDENVLIGGFIIQGTGSKKVIVRGIGPSLSNAGIQGVLADPTLELYANDVRLATNDNWKESQEAQVRGTGIPPANDSESAIVATLSPGAYTAILRGKNNGTGIGLAEVYDIDSVPTNELGNISTRGFVDRGDNILIGGVIVGPPAGSSRRILVRAIGPSLTNFAVNNPLQDPTVELHNGNGAMLAFNDNWKESSQQAAIRGTGLTPIDNREAAILTTVSAGAYTAIVRGKNNTIGVALVEVYSLSN